jgi:hypothetical protein
MVEKREKPLGLDMSFQEALARFAATRPSEVESAIKAGRREQMEPRQGEFQLVHYQTTECQADLTLDPTNETMWATQQQIADAFGIATNTVGEHLGNIFREGELEQAATTRKFRAVAKNGKEYNLLHYNLEAILSVGYRVSSKRATAFRQFATGILKDYLVQGFAINEARLKDDPHALRELAARVRALRSDEKNIYQGVREVFAFGTSDYNKDSPAVHAFYAKLQDKFLHAVTGKTSAEIRLERADHKRPAMGLTAMKGDYPARADIDTGKNYLDEQELYELHILCEQFLLFVESKAIRGQKLTMVELAQKFDELMRIQGHTAFPEYQGYLAARAKAHAHREYDAWFERTKGLPKEQKRLA